MRLAVYNSGVLAEARGIAVVLAMVLGACSKAPAPSSAAPHNATSDPWYRTATEELIHLSRGASDAYAQGNSDKASALIEQGEPVASRLLAVPKPTLQAARAASDLDELYGKMLFKNRHYGWARLQFQKNLARWKHWQPQTPDTAARWRAAQTAIDDCDKKLEAPVL